MSQRQGKVVVVDPGYDSYEAERGVLETAGYRLEVFRGEREDLGGRLELARGAVGVFVRWTLVDEAFLDALPGLKAVVRYGVGYENIDIPAATARGVRAANISGYATHSVSDHALALLLACARGLLLGARMFPERWTQPPRPDVFELHDRTLGIVGLGRIGGALARKAQPLFARVIAYDPYIPDAQFDAAGAVKAELDTLLAESDAVSLHCNETPETRGLINRDAFGKMQRRPILVNTARGPVVDEDALLEALNADRIHSAALDVFSEEPPRADRVALVAHPRVIVTGHYAWYSASAIVELQRRGAENLLALLEGRPCEDCLNP